MRQVLWPSGLPTGGALPLVAPLQPGLIPRATAEPPQVADSPAHQSLVELLMDFPCTHTNTKSIMCHYNLQRLVICYFARGPVKRRKFSLLTSMPCPEVMGGDAVP